MFQHGVIENFKITLLKFDVISVEINFNINIDFFKNIFISIYASNFNNYIVFSIRRTLGALHGPKLAPLLFNSLTLPDTLRDQCDHSKSFGTYFPWRFVSLRRSMTEASCWLLSGCCGRTCHSGYDWPAGTSS